jgi:hypothetical protein
MAVVRLYILRCHLIRSTILAFRRKDRAKPRRTLVNIASLETGTYTRDLPSSMTCLSVDICEVVRTVT